MGGQTQQEDPQHTRCGRQHRGVEAEAEQQVHDLVAGHDPDRRDEGQRPQQQAQRPHHDGPELAFVALCHRPRHRRQEHHAQGQADDPERDLQHAEGDRVADDRTDGHGTRERSVDEEGDLVGAHPDGAGQHQPERLARGPVARVGHEGVGEAAAKCRQLHDKMAQGTDDDPDGHPEDAQGRPQQDRTEDDAGVVDDGGQGRGTEPFLRLEDGGHHRSGREEDGRDQHQTRELHCELGGGLVEAGHEDRYQHGREDRQQDRQRQQDHEHEVEHGRGHTPRTWALAVGDELREDGDERGADGAGRNQLEHEVGDAEGRVVGVELPERVLAAEEVAQHEHTQPAKHARDEERAGDDEPGAGEGAPAHGSRSGSAGGVSSSGRVSCFGSSRARG